MDINIITEKLTNAGYHRGTRNRIDETTGLEIIDWSHRRFLTMFSLYVATDGSVKYVERTDIKFNPQLHRKAPVITKIFHTKDLFR